MTKTTMSDLEMEEKETGSSVPAVCAPELLEMEKMTNDVARALFSRAGKVVAVLAAGDLSSFGPLL